ncbi:hypothetical protein H6F77_06650 [Microcoleus sp. FACHB-831]|uniref:WGxxGxxG family protein n=1 Tax=Microcoleus sp. FACHB-831 TaxID=2692827 RepID=UPI001685939B|nr:WGxxGxxG family protein [Microcoleus sp. FACHB-831]MBD1920763.1 hypothetical protein [Microcoleus sp. FACHB-831]
MNRSQLSKVLFSGVFAANLAILSLSLPASAQNTDTPTQRPNTDVAPLQNDVVETQTQRDRDFNLGWLGLLGLAGLGGLTRKREQPMRSPKTNREPHTVGRSNDL